MSITFAKQLRAPVGLSSRPDGTELAILSLCMTRNDLQQMIHQVEDLSDSVFRRFQRDVVVHYRRHAEDQESIAIALTDKNLLTGDGRARERVSETLAMLDHVHDPFITGA